MQFLQSVLYWPQYMSLSLSGPLYHCHLHHCKIGYHHDQSQGLSRAVYAVRRLNGNTHLRAIEQDLKREPVNLVMIIFQSLGDRLCLY